MEEIMKDAVNLGVAAVIALVLMRYVLNSNKNVMAQNVSLYNGFVADSAQREEQYRADIKRREKEYRDRENILLAESTRREEILKQESERREQILKTEALKREAALMATIEGFSATMQRISETMDDIRDTTETMQDKIGGIENVLQNYKITKIRGGEVGEKDSG